MRRDEVLAHRVRVQWSDAVLDLGVQDTGPDGAAWALALRGASVDDPVLLWTLRGAPHVYRRADLPSVAAAVAPFGDADAAKRVYDASRPWKQVGLPALAALDEVAAALREVVVGPTPKGEASGALARRLPEHHLRDCVPCGATHPWEMPFRLAAVRAGLELQPGTSPPVLQPSPPYAPLPEPDPRHDVVRAALRLLGPTTPRLVAGFVEAPLQDVQARWPSDAEEVDVDGERRWLLPTPAVEPPVPLALLGPYDLLLQSRDREVVSDDPARLKDLYRTLGRPGAVLDTRGAVVGTWRPRQSGASLRVQVDLWSAVDRGGLGEAAERLAAHRGRRLAGVDVVGVDDA